MKKKHMKLAPIRFTTGIILCGAVLIVLIPNAFNIFCASKYFCRNKKAKKKPGGKRGGPICVIHADTFDQSLTDTVIPEISNLTGIETVTLKNNIQVGMYKTMGYREMIENSSVTVIVLHEALLSDPWLHYAMAFCTRKDIKSLCLCYDEGINLNCLHQTMQDLIHLGCRTMSFKTKKLKQLSNPKQFAKELAKMIVKFDVEITPCPVIEGTRHDREKTWKYDAYIMHDSTDTWVLSHTMPFLDQQENVNVCFSEGILLGKYLYQGYSEAIHSSKSVIIFLTPSMLQNPLFEYQLSLALCCKGHGSVFFILNQNCLDRISNNRTLKYAIAACKKIYIKHHKNNP